MLQVIKSIACVCVFVLLATGLQFFAVGAVTNDTIDMSQYNVLECVMQAMWWLLAACVGVIVSFVK